MSRIRSTATSYYIHRFSHTHVREQGLWQRPEQLPKPAERRKQWTPQPPLSQHPQAQVSRYVFLGILPGFDHLVTYLLNRMVGSWFDSPPSGIFKGLFAVDKGKKDLFPPAILRSIQWGITPGNSKKKKKNFLPVVHMFWDFFCDSSLVMHLPKISTFCHFAVSQQSTVLEFLGQDSNFGTNKKAL